MTLLEKYEIVNKTENITQLCEAIILIGKSNNNVIHGRIKDFDSIRMADNCLKSYESYSQINNCTREFGIRQQLLYLIYYKN